MSARLDFSDPIAVARWLVGLRLAIDDADAVTTDMLRPQRRRELGPALHADNYGKAIAQIRQAIDYADPRSDGSKPDGGDQ